MFVVIAVSLITLIVFEPLMTVVHRWVFHGPLWRLHRSHHAFQNSHRLVLNDLIWAVHLLASGAVAALGFWFRTGMRGQVALGLGVGAALYALAYIFVHDGVAHGRFRIPSAVRGMAFLRRLTR